MNDDTGAANRGWYVLALLTASYAVNFLDRQVVNILAESIKLDLKISDTQLGLLTGTAFGLFYTTLGLPIARLADRYNRVRIMAIALAVWSGFTVLCGTAVTYSQLFALRLGVGVGEAGGSPPAQSLIADIFPTRTRTMALAVFSLGVPLGSFLGFLLGGYVNQMWGWRTAFVIAGLPGLLLALLVFFTLREPRRGQSDALPGIVASEMAVPPLGVSLRELFQRRSFIRLVLGGTCGIFMVYVTNAWLPPFFIRVHHFDSAQVGGWIALCVGLGGLLGSVTGGWLATRLRRKHERAEVWVIATSSSLVGPALLATLFAPTPALALVSMFVLYMLSYVWIGPTSALIQRIAPLRSRTLAAAIQLSVANVLALLFGPPLVGYLSDRLHPSLGAESVRYALACTAFVALLGAITYLSAGRYLRSDFRATEQARATPAI